MRIALPRLMAIRKRKFFDARYCPERRRATILACMLFWSVISYLLISHLVCRATQVCGNSMSPTLQDGDRRLVDRWTYLHSSPRRGDVVVVAWPDENDLSVKRIIALPFERVRIKDGRVWINGRALAEPYLSSGVVTLPGVLSTNSYVVEDGCYFVLGDNRPESWDSRSFGALPKQKIIGRVHAR